MTINTITDLIYDTLMNNSVLYEKLELDEVTHQEVEAYRGRVCFDYKGSHIELNITLK